MLGAVSSLVYSSSCICLRLGVYNLEGARVLVSIIVARLGIIICPNSSVQPALHIHSSKMDKLTMTQADNIQPVSGDDSSGSLRTGDEKIIEQLEHTGAEIGMTWRSIGAATVCENTRSIICLHNLIILVDGNVLQRIPFYSPDSTDDFEFH